MYLTKIEEFFSQKRGQGLILSPKDWQLAKEWQREGIPLAVVLRGIGRSFEQADSGKKIHSLAYCSPEVKRLWTQYQQLREGEFSLEAGNNRPPRLLELEACLQEALKNCEAERLKTLQGFQREFQELAGQDADNWESGLAVSVERLLARLKALTPPQELDAVKARIKERLQDYEARMSRQAYRQTVDNLVAEHLLAKHDLAPFSVYVE